MKITGFILAFYVLLAAAIPCCAVDNCPEDKAEKSLKHEQGDQDCGACSPFFSCEGCAAATITFQPLQFELPAAVVSPVYAGYKPSSLSETHFDFWQPPKLA